VKSIATIVTAAALAAFLGGLRRRIGVAVNRIRRHAAAGRERAAAERAVHDYRAQAGYRNHGPTRRVREPRDGIGGRHGHPGHRRAGTRNTTTTVNCTSSCTASVQALSGQQHLHRLAVRRSERSGAAALDRLANGDDCGRHQH